jgi:hypothetical protein
LSAIDGDFDFLFDAGGLRCLCGGNSLVFGLFAGLTSFRRVLQSFVVEKLLLADRPNKIQSAVYAVD